MLHKVIDYICHRFALIYAFGSPGVRCQNAETLKR